MEKRQKEKKTVLLEFIYELQFLGSGLKPPLAVLLNCPNGPQKIERVTGSGKNEKELNEYFNVLRLKAFEIQKTILLQGRKLTIQSFSDLWFGKDEEKHMLLELFDHHNSQIKQLIGNQYSKATYLKYVTTRDHTKDFLKDNFQLDDISFDSLNYKFITDFEFWLKTKRQCNHNSTIKYLTNFKKIVHISVKNGWLDRNPFTGFKMMKEDVDRAYLTSYELEILRTKEFVSERLSQVRDIFLFSCYTGLAYSDTQKLSTLDIVKGVDGEKWIFIKRQKTDSLSRIPLLPRALEILKKYESDPRCQSKAKVLPLLSNQKMNGYLHEISAVCGINKKMTYHTARHTFATTITLTNGVPLETVGNMLGHKNLKTTQHYAKILDVKISADMKALKEKLKTEISKVSDTDQSL